MWKLSLWFLHFFALFNSSFAMSEQLQNFFASVHEKCKAETGATEESILSTQNGGKMTDDYAYKCYLKCTMIELGTMNHHGEVDVDDAIAKLPKEMLDIGIGLLIKTCGTKKGADDCETGWLTLKCYQETDPTIFVTI